MKTQLICLLFIILILSGCLEEGHLHKHFTTFKPIDIGDGWQLSTPSAEGIDSLGLVNVFKDVYNHKKAWTLRSMLVIRNGKLIAESYFKNDADRYRYNAVWSCTKQVTGIVTGIAIQEGYIASVKDSIRDYLVPELINHPDKKNITIEQILTMTAGINYNNYVDSYTLRRQVPHNSVEFVLNKKLKWTPGTHFLYNDGTPQLLSAIIQRQTGKTLAQYADEKFFSRIGLTRYTWTTYPDGLTLASFGLAMPSRELAKIAQCVCDNGRFNAQQVIPINWMHEMLTTHSSVLHTDPAMGYLWWVYENSDLICMVGRAGQFAVIIPSKHLVVIFTSIEELSGDNQFGANNAFFFAERIADISD